MRGRHHRYALAVAVVAAALLPAVPGGHADAAVREIALVRDGSVYRVPVTLDGRVVRRFIVDTGAGEVQVSTDVFRALFPRGAARPVHLPDGVYRLADGREVRNRRFLIPSLRIGDRELRGVDRKST